MCLKTLDCLTIVWGIMLIHSIWHSYGRIWRAWISSFPKHFGETHRWQRLVITQWLCRVLIPSWSSGNEDNSQKWETICCVLHLISQRKAEKLFGRLEFWKQREHEAVWHLKQGKVPKLLRLQCQDLWKIGMLDNTMSNSVRFLSLWS